MSCAISSTQAAAGGVDLFRVFDCLNWVDNMRVAMDAVRAENKLCEAAICYTGDILDPARAKYDLKYYVALAKELEQAGAHIIAVKDMAGLLKPAAARVLFKALREATDLPIHFHTHDTSGLSAATVLAAVDSGVDAIDAAMDALSGNTSQPCLGSLVEALRGTERDPGLEPEWIRRISFYWEAVRNQYAAFESDLKGPASEVYLHEMPGGQFTNLKEQARSLGLETRWHEVAQAYHDVNLMFGDIVKVTPSSKVVGDMALMMVSQDLTVADVENPAKDIAFPDSVVSMLRGDLGQSPGGWPPALQKKVLKGDKPITERPGSLLKTADLPALRAELEAKLERKVSEFEFASSLMYPKVFADFAAAQEAYGPVSVLPTPVYFYGMRSEDEIFVDIERGKTLVVRCLAVGDSDDKGMVTVFFELNGQPRRVKVPDRSRGDAASKLRRKAEPGNEAHVGAPMPGVVSTVAVAAGQPVKAGDVLLSIEAMKMETALHAERDGTIAELAGPGRRPDRRQGPAGRVWVRGRHTLQRTVLLRARARKRLLADRAVRARLVLALHAAVKIGEQLAAFRLEGAAGMNDRRDAVDAEGAEIVAQLAPGGERPHLAPEPQAERAHVAAAAAAQLVAIVEGEHVALFDGALEQVDMDAVGVGHHPHRRVDLGAGDAVALVVGQHGADLDQRLVGGPRHRRAAEGPHHAGAGDQRHDFVTCEHQRR